jgi:hypothetical protein
MIAAAARGALGLARGALLVCGPLLCSTAASQAWLPAEDVGAVTLDYTDILNKKHYLPDGSEVDVGHTRTRVIAVGASYGLTDRVMVRAALPLVQTRFYGERPHPTEVDDGDEHTTVTDLHVALHVQWLTRPVAVAPYVAAVIPTHDYPTLGHASPGRGLEEWWLGFYAAASLHEWIPRSYVQARYNYAFVEQVAGVAHDRSNIDVEAGWYASPDWSLRLLASWQDTHGGIPVPIPPSDPLYAYHDQLAAESFLKVGGGVSWALSPRVGVYALYLQSLRGTNGHKVDHQVSVGLGYGLRQR